MKRRGRKRSAARKRIDRTIVAVLELARAKNFSAARTREMLRARMSRSRSSYCMWNRALGEILGGGGMRSVPCFAQLELFGKAS